MRGTGGLSKVAPRLGLRHRPAALPDEVVVVSPHLDDAVLSLGAAIAAATRTGARVTVLTVLAGDPGSALEAGQWDRSAGFATLGEAVRARRREDERACELVGARPVWLPYCDEQYPRGGTDEAIRADVVAAVGSAAVLIPGHPLKHPDHEWLRRLLDGAFDPAHLGVYLEQPYATWTDRPLPDLPWQPLRARRLDRHRKLEACRAYATQLPLLGDVLEPMTRYARRAGGETAAWLRT
jgi:LmbE family N-acetylglucosaminyl deacetylase